jgi:NAD+ kinase
MKFRNIKIIINPRKDWAKQTADELIDLLKNKEFNVVETNAELTICIGGDGTILFANHDKNIEGTVLGIGGDKSKICILNKNNWKRNIIQLLRAGKTENRQMLQAKTNSKKYSAINDFVIHSKDYRVIEITLMINGNKHFFEGDGIILSSATGSFAYAYSAGGKKLRPRSKKIQAVPIAPYLRVFKPHILPSNSTFKIMIDRKSAFIVDGIFISNIDPHEAITIKSGGYIKFLCK